ncbi:MAG: helix-turn-helix domain-containing protein [Candidatus Poribacteria bacterium]|nr:helix-turn-helix domain-containing protein [Candidatus Poribacteria bacterium]
MKKRELFMKKGEKVVKENSRKGRILNFLEKHPGEHQTSEIASNTGLSTSSASNVLGELTREGKIEKIQGGTYSKKDDSVSSSPQTHSGDASRSEADNQVTINKALSLFDKVLDNTAQTIQGELYTTATMAEKTDLIKSLRWLGATLDQLMKRWNLEHHGYDINSRQAQEDAKAKTEEREQAALKDAPIEDQIVVVGHYHPDMQEVLKNLPKKDLDASKV